jgi:phosphoglycolate phosphatase
MIARLPSCILFDLDGTLLDSLPGIEYSVRHAFATCNLAPPQKSLRKLIGPPIRTILAELGNILESAVLDKLEMEFRASYDSEGWQRTSCFPHAKSVLEEFHERGYRLFVVSNKPRHISLKTLTTENLINLFESIVTRDSRLPSYPSKREMIKGLMNESNIAPEDCVFVGDTIEDAEAARGNSIKFAYMAHGYGDISKEVSASFDYKLDDFRQFVPMMAKGAFVHD